MLGMLPSIGLMGSSLGEGGMSTLGMGALIGMAGQLIGQNTSYGSLNVPNAAGSEFDQNQMNQILAMNNSFLQQGTNVTGGFSQYLGSSNGIQPGQNFPLGTPLGAYQNYSTSPYAQYMQQQQQGFGFNSGQMFGNSFYSPEPWQNQTPWQQNAQEGWGNTNTPPWENRFGRDKTQQSSHHHHHHHHHHHVHHQHHQHHKDPKTTNPGTTPPPPPPAVEIAEPIISNNATTSDVSSNPGVSPLFSSTLNLPTTAPTNAPGTSPAQAQQMLNYLQATSPNLTTSQFLSQAADINHNLNTQVGATSAAAATSRIGDQRIEVPFTVDAHAYYNSETQQTVPVKSVNIEQEGMTSNHVLAYNEGQNTTYQAVMPNAQVGQSYQVGVTWQDGASGNWSYKAYGSGNQVNIFSPYA